MSCLSKLRDLWKYGGMPPKRGLKRERFFLKRAIRRTEKWNRRNPHHGFIACECLDCWNVTKKQNNRYERLAQIEKRL